ncbi:MAG: dynamin family protein [Acidihalobacter sp.]|uniref:LeoA/HP0731 family dynamin-like GTPase n=1 Tax=Acidihalobacter sp. TaxID=1872108 RepID=UPI00307D932C
MEAFEQFSSDKQATLDALAKLRELLGELGEVGIDVDGDIGKVSDAVESVQSDVLRIALLGAYSDGKTNVIAAWLGKVMDDMNIDMDESSDRLAVYHPQGLPGQCEIVDTPGLFGDKVKTVDGEQVMYEDITKRYISQAHLILYVVDATNPLRDSHGAIVRWLLRDLNKLTSTIFVINKMDAVTDLTESTLFAEQAAIKKQNLSSKLQRVAGLSAEEVSKLNIVCLASDPNKRGLEFWFSKLEQYEARSRINDLKETTSKILSQTVPEVLRAKTGLDVVRDIVGKKITIAREEMDLLQSFEQQNREECSRIQEDIKAGRSEIKRLGAELFAELDGIEKQLLGQTRSLELQGIRAFLEDELGYEDGTVGYKLNLKIKGAIDRFFSQSSAVTSRLTLDIERELDSNQSFLDSMGGMAAKGAGAALKGLGKMDPSILKASIFAARDTLRNATGIAIKFKPWGAAKLSGNVVKYAPAAGAAITVVTELVEAQQDYQREAELREVKQSIVDTIKAPFKDIYAILSDDEKLFDSFAPQLREFEKVVTAMNDSARTIADNRVRLESVQKRLGTLSMPAIGQQK